MTPIFTCGHGAKEGEEGLTISTKAHSRDNNRVVVYKTVCNNCYQVYEEEGLILFGEAAEAKWLDGE